MVEQMPITVRRGDILIDHMVALRAEIALSKGIATFQHPEFTWLQSRAINSIAQLVESIVIHEGLIIPIPAYKTPLDIGSGYRSISQYLSVEIINMDEWAEVISKDPKVISELQRMESENTPPEFIDRWKTTYFDMVLSYWTIASMADRHGLSLRTSSTNPPIPNRYGNFADTSLRSIENVVQQEIDTMNKGLKEDFFKLDVPIIFNYVIEKAWHRADIIPVALKVREMREARAFRKQLALLADAAAVRDKKAMYQICDEINDKIKALAKKVQQRSGVAPIVLWVILARPGGAALPILAQRCAALALLGCFGIQSVPFHFSSFATQRATRFVEVPPLSFWRFWRLKPVCPRISRK